MNLNWLESIIYGLFSGLADILPVSAQAHKTLLLKVFGTRGNTELLDMMIHLALIAALYEACRSTFVRMSRARRLSLTPKKKRRRPLDVRSLMDLSMLRTMLIPVLLGFFLYRKAADLRGNLILMAVFLFVNGLILYIPQFLPSGNRDSRTLSRVEGLLMGLGGTISVVPGISAVGTMISVGSVCGVERTYCLDLALMTNLFLNAGFTVFDVMAIADKGLGNLSAVILVRYLVAALAAFLGASLGIRVLRRLSGYAGFGFYCFGMALFIFVLNLIV